MTANLDPEPRLVSSPDFFWRHAAGKWPTRAAYEADRPHLGRSAVWRQVSMSDQVTDAGTQTLDEVLDEVFRALHPEADRSDYKLIALDGEWMSECEEPTGEMLVYSTFAFVAKAAELAQAA